MGLLECMKYHKNQSKMILYWDIETLSYNKINGRNKPTLYKNVTYSVAIGWFNGYEIDVEVFPSFEAFYDDFYKYVNRRDTITKSKTDIVMIAHNCNKYDNHFLLKDTMRYFDNITRENIYLKSAEENEHTLKMQEATILAKNKNVILEKRVKSSINLDLTMFLNGFKFNIIDNFMKTNTSIATLGKKLLDGGYLTENQLKTDFNYTIFDKDNDMSDSEAYDYAVKCFDNLTSEQLTYIHNDVIILGMCHIHYSDIFPNFDYNKLTFSLNIMESYLNNEMTRFQLLNQYQDIKISYTHYQFHDMNFYDYIKSFYRGGLNMYNTKYINKLIDEPCFSIDINSSYPYVMYHEKIPTWLYFYEHYSEPTLIPTFLHDDNYFSLYKIDKDVFNRDILTKIKSRVLRQMIVKYYNNDNDYVNINTNTLRMIQDITGIDCTHIRVNSFVIYECEYFHARDIIFQNYFIKTQGKLKNKINMTSPYDYHITDDINEHPYSNEEVMLSKVVLNGLYGIPALRSHFNLFRLDENNEMYNIINGYKNTERNILFSTFVTSRSLYNLLVPFQYLTENEIDDNFIYCDTDSLYMKSVAKPLLNPSLFDPISLGKWDIENEQIDKMFVLNHKKYAYVTNGKIKIASAGIPKNAFDTSVDFETFVREQFFDGAIIENNKSIYNNQGTISIYPSKTEIVKGNVYDEYFSDELNMKREFILKDAREKFDHSQFDDILYIESDIGSFSLNDLFPVERSVHNKSNLNILKMQHDDIKKGNC